MARRILALDLGSHMLKAAMIESSLSRCRVTGLFQQPRALDRSLSEQLQEFCTAHQLYADTVLSCLPGELTSHRLLTLPFAQVRQINQAVPFELESLIPFSLDEVVIANQTIQRIDKGTRTLAVAVLKRTVAEHLETLTQVGLDPAQILFAPLAPLALLPLAGVDVSGTCALLNVEGNRTSVALLRDGRLSGVRTFGSGLNHVEGLNTFLQELRWTILALNPDNLPFLTKVFLCGEGAYSLQLQCEVEREFAVEIVPFQQFSVSAISESQREEQSVFATCLGIGLHEALRGTTPMVNLRQGEFAPQHHNESVRSESRRLGWLAVSVAAAASLAFLLDVHRLNLRYQALHQEVRRTFVAALPDTQTVVNEKVQLEDAVEILQKRQHILNGSSIGSPLDALRHLSTVIPEQMTLDLDEWVFDGDAVRLQGTTTSFEAAEAIKTAILSLGFFREAQLKDVKTVAGSKKVAFGLQLFFQKDDASAEKQEEKGRGQQANGGRSHPDASRKEG